MVANKTAARPCALTLTRFDETSRAGALLLEKGGGSWPLNFEHRAAWEAYDPSSLVYLSPDATDVLTELDPNKVRKSRPSTPNRQDRPPSWPAGCFLALGSGLGLVGTVSARR